MAADPLALDQVQSIKMTREQVRVCKRAARARKLRFGVWARMTLVEAATRPAPAHANGATNGSSSHTLLTTPVLPVRGGG